MEHEKDLEEQIFSTGNRLLNPPTSEGELLHILDDVEALLSRVEQSPSPSLSSALLPATNALVARVLLRHSNMDIKVAVASCISEITRITAPDAPYDDELMKEIFQIIVESFAKLDDVSDRIFVRRVSILETVAKVRSCVVMLDLECDDLILEMFHHFLNTIRDNHPDNVFTSMETIMTLVLDESEEISSELISCLLLCVKVDNKDVLPIAKKLATSVITKCAMKLKPCLVEAVESMGATLTDYDHIVNSICQESSDVLEQNNVKASGECLVDDSKLSERTVSDELPEGSAKTEAEVGCPEQICPTTDKSTMTEEVYPEGSGTAIDKLPKSVMSNGSAQIGSGNSLLEPIAPNKKAEHTRRSSLSKNNAVAAKAEKANLDSSIVEEVVASDHSSKKRSRRKVDPVIQSTDTTDQPQIDTDKEGVPHRRKGRVKDVDGSPPEVPSDKVPETTAPLGKRKRQPPTFSDGGNLSLASPTHENRPGSSHRKRGRPSGLKTPGKNIAVYAADDLPASPSGGKRASISEQTKDELAQSKDVVSKKQTDETSDSEAKPPRRSGKRSRAENVNDNEIPRISHSKKEVEEINDLEGKQVREKNKKAHLRKVGSAGKQLASEIKQPKGSASTEGTGEQNQKAKVSSPKSAAIADKARSPLEDSSKTKSRKTKSRRTKSVREEEEPISATPHHMQKLDDSLVGSKIKVWWPDDERFYRGVVDLYDPTTEKHTILYADGDVETLQLKDERWELVEGDSSSDEGEAQGEVQGEVEDLRSPDVSEEPPKKGKRKSDSAPRETKMDKQAKSASGKSKGDGTLDGGKQSGEALKSPSDRKGKFSKPGTKLDDITTPTPGSKSKEKRGGKSKDDAPKNSSKTPKEDTASNSKDDDAKIAGKSKDGMSKTGRKRKDSMKSKDITPITGSRSEDETPKTAMKSTEDSGVPTGIKTKSNTPHSGSSKSKEGAPKTGRKPRGNKTPKTGIKSDVNGSVSGKRKSAATEAVEGNEDSAAKEDATSLKGSEPKSLDKRRRRA